MADISAPQAQALTKRVGTAYGFTQATEDHIAQLIYQTRVDAIIESYKACAHTVQTQLAPDWMPPKRLLEEQARIARDHAASVSETFRESLASQVKQFLASYQPTRAQPQDQGDNQDDDDDRKVLAGLALIALRAALAAHLANWMQDWLGWKAPQVAQVETCSGDNAGTTLFLDDLSNNYIQVGDNVDITTLAIAVVPEESSRDFCSDFAGNVYAWVDYDLIPDFPAHVGCIHRKLLLVNGVLQEMP